MKIALQRIVDLLNAVERSAIERLISYIDPIYVFRKLLTRGRGEIDRESNSIPRIGCKLAIVLCAALAGASTSTSAQVVLKASHQFPGGKGDPRDEMDEEFST